MDRGDLAEKRTAIGTGVFVNSVTDVTDQSGVTVGRQRYRVLNFRPERRPTSRSAALPHWPAPNTARPHVVVSHAPDAGIAAPVTVGEQLPTLRVPLTRTLIAAAAIASHDWEPIHHDPAAARASGLDDVFMNILSTNGFVGRFVTDWAGPDATLKAIRIRLGAPNYPGDTMELQGRVVGVESESDGREVEVSVRGANAGGNHVTGAVVVGFPTRGCRYLPEILVEPTGLQQNPASCRIVST